LSARAAAQLDYLGFTQVFHYPRGKADWLVRGLPTEPVAMTAQRLRALPYYLNNLAPGPRTAWIKLTNRARVDEYVVDDLPRLAPDDLVPRFHRNKSPRAAVLNRDGVLLGSIDREAEGLRAIDAVNGGPQTIRPEMTPALASTLLGEHPYLLVTTAMGTYLGRYRLSILANSG
jgi:hypothetical protein